MGAALVVLLLVAGTLIASMITGRDDVSVSPSSAGGSTGVAVPAPADPGADAGSAADSKGVSGFASGGAADGAAKSADQARTESRSAALQPETGGGGADLATSDAGRRRVRTADVTVRVRDLRAAVTRVRTVADGLGGTVGSESTTLDGKGSATVVLRVPEPKLDQALDQVAAVGTELNRTTTSEDVTADLADLDSRVASQRASVARVRALMDRATRLQDVVLLEGELSRRQSDLEAAEARRRALGDQADLATATVQLETAAPAPKPAKDDSGFVTGLKDGWHALAASTRVVVTVIGALLPVAVLLAVAGVPAALIRRRRRHATTP